MAKIDDLIKELRDAIKDPKDAKKSSLAFNHLAKTQIAQMAGIEIKCQRKHLDCKIVLFPSILIV